MSRWVELKGTDWFYKFSSISHKCSKSLSRADFPLLFDDDISSSNNKGKSARDKLLEHLCEIDEILIKNSTVCGQLDEEKYLSLQQICLAQLYTNLENQCQIRQNEQASSIWACVNRVPEVSVDVEENSANKDMCLVDWRKMIECVWVCVSVCLRELGNYLTLSKNIYFNWLTSLYMGKGLQW